MDLPLVPSEVSSPLHPSTCQQSENDFIRMSETLTLDPESLERCFEPVNDDLSNFDFDLCFTPLQMAIRCHHSQCVEFLIVRGANTKYFGGIGDAVTSAIIFNENNILQLLISKYNMKPSNDRFDYINAESSSMYVYFAAKYGSTESLQILLNHGALTENIEYLKNPIYQVFPTPALTAIMHEKFNNLKFLLLNGAICDFEKSGFIYSNEKNYDLLSMPLRIGVSIINNLQTKIEIVQLLYDFGLDLKKPAKNGNNLIDMLNSKEIHTQMKQYLEITNCEIFNDMEFPENHRKILVNHILRLTSNPMSLKGQCRLKIMKTMGSKYCMKSCESLDLPQNLKNYLYFD